MHRGPRLLQLCSAHSTPQRSVVGKGQQCQDKKHQHGHAARMTCADPLLADREEEGPDDELQLARVLVVAQQGESVVGPAGARILIEEVDHAQQNLLWALFGADTRRELRSARAEEVHEVAEARRDALLDHPRRRAREQEDVEDGQERRRESNVVPPDRDYQTVVFGYVVTDKGVLLKQAPVSICDG
eukprot:2091712-Rhodomonas_salina.2